MSEKYAIVVDGVVERVVMADPASAGAGWVPLGNARAARGYTYDGGVFSRPATVAQQRDSVTIAQLQRALTESELIAIVDSDAAALQKAVARLQFFNSIGRELSKQNVQQLLNVLVANDVMTAARGLSIYKSLTGTD